MYIRFENDTFKNTATSPKGELDKYSQAHIFCTVSVISWQPLTNRKYKDYIYRKMLVQEYLKKKKNI